MTAKKTTQRQGFKTNEFIVYPAHGVGQIVAIEEQEVAGAKLELFVINFVKDKMTLRVPISKIATSACASSPRAAGEARARDAQGPRPHQAHHVVAPRAGIRSQDQLRRHRCDRGGRARPVPLRYAAGAVLFRAPALRSRARPAVARNLGGAARHRDRGDQGDRGRARQGPASWSEAGRSKRWSRKKRRNPTRRPTTKQRPGRKTGPFVLGGQRER